MPIPKSGTVQPRYQMHLQADSPGIRPGVRPSALVQDNIFGRRSGTVVASPWGSVQNPSPGAYTDIGSGGTVTYAATTVTDTAKAWVTNEWAGRRVVVAGKVRVVASNTSTVLTLTGSSWSGGTPSNGTLYTIDPFAPDGIGPPPMNWPVELTKHGNTQAW